MTAAILTSEADFALIVIAAIRRRPREEPRGKGGADCVGSRPGTPGHATRECPQFGYFGLTRIKKVAPRLKARVWYFPMDEAEVDLEVEDEIYGL